METSAITLFSRWRPLRALRLSAVLSVVAAAIVIPLAPAGSAAAATDPDLCYIVADTGGANGGNDLLVEYDVGTDTFSQIGTGTGTNNIEAAALWPGTDTLYAIDADRLGTIDLTTGVYSSLGSAFGTADGADGSQPLTDADGMAFDPFTGVIWAAERNSGSADYVFLIDPVTGAIVRDAFGPGVDYVVSTPYSAGSPDIDDFAISADDGRLFAVANLNNTVSTQLLVEIDRTNGDQTLVGPLGQEDMEGLGVDAFGNFYATDGTNERLYDVNIVTGAATNPRSINIAGDYESVSCLTGTTSTIGGTVFRDDDADGSLDPGEPGQGGATVQLVRDTDGDGAVDPGERVVATQTSAADGSYEYEIAAVGDFVVQVLPATLPPASSTTTATEVGASVPNLGDTSTGNDFGFAPLPSLSGSVLDENGDPIEGVTVTIDDGAGYTADTTTLADGSYSFTGLAPGTYTVTETQPTGYGEVSTTAGTSGGDDSVPNVVSGIVLSAGVVASGYDFVEGFGSIAGSVFVDANDNGVFDVGESGIAGAQVRLSATDDGGNVIDTTVSTNGSGDYVFGGLLSGSYTITEVTPSGYLDGDDAPGSTGGSAVNPGDEINGVTLAAGEDATDYDFGELAAASISGSVLDEHGAPIAGVTVTLSGTDDRGAITPVSVLTSADGSYSFDGLRPGTYTVTETQPAGFGEGGESSDDVGASVSTNVISGLSLAVGGSSANNDFVETYSSIGGNVFVDVDADGVRDAGEPGLPGVTVRLNGIDPRGAISEMVATTGSDGSYLFDDLLAGTYTITEDTPPEFNDGVDTAGSVGGTPVNPGDEINTIALPAGTDAVDYDFGEVGAVVAGTVWVDDDRDGAIGADEELRLEGVTIVLETPAGAEIDRTTTAADGSFRFVGLAAGDYVVVQEQPSGYGSTIPNRLDLTVPASGVTDADFGEDLGSIGDVVFDDVDGDGVQDPTEAGIAGVVIELRDDSGATIASTTSAAEGRYSFDRLTPGTYTLAFFAPDGKSLTTTGEGTPTTDSDPDWVTGVTSDVDIGVDETSGLVDRRTEVDAGIVDTVIDLAVTVEPDRPTAGVGEQVTFSFDADNLSEVPILDGARVVVELPPAVTLDRVEAPGWDVQISGSTLTLELPGPLLPGASLPPFAVVTTVVSATASTSLNVSIGTIDAESETTFVNNDDAAAFTVPVRSTPTSTPTPTPTSTPTSTPTPIATPSTPTLPRTGSDAGVVIRVALGLLAAGFLLAAVGGRRRRLAGA